MDEVDWLCDRVVVMDYGCILVFDMFVALKVLVGVGCMVMVMVLGDLIYLGDALVVVVDGVELVCVGDFCIYFGVDDFCGLLFCIIVVVEEFGYEVYDLLVIELMFEFVFIYFIGRDLRE